MGVKMRLTVSRLSTYSISVTWLAIDYLDRHVGGNDSANVLRLGVLICVEPDPIASDATSHCQPKNCDPWNLFIFLASNQRGFKTRIISKLCRFLSPPEFKKKK